MRTWVTPQDVQAEWPDALLDEEILERLITAAQEVLEPFAPTLPAEAAVPARYQEALILHIREVWRAAERDGDVIGVGEFAVRARSMTDMVKSLLRPKRGKPTLR